MNAALETITVLLVDDHDIVRQGLKALLATDSGISVIAEARTGREAVRLAQELRPQVVVMDLAMPAMNGWEATRQILKAIPSAKVLVLSTYHEDDHVQQAITAGATAYLIKQTSATDLVLAIREVRNGNAFFSPSVAQGLRARTFPQAKPADVETVPAVQLSLREAEVLQLIAEGFANKQIAGELSLSVKTIEKHRQQLMNKLKIHNTAGLVRHAAAHDIIETPRGGVPQYPDDSNGVSSRHRGL